MTSPDDTIPIRVGNTMLPPSHAAAHRAEPRIALVMTPPPDFAETAVDKALAIVDAEEALVAVTSEALDPSPLNDAPSSIADLRATIRITPRKRCDSGVIDMRDLHPPDEEPASARR